MKILASSLFCLVLAASQCLAIKGGPDYGGRNIRTTGTYAGVMIPSSVGSNSIGLFSIVIPKTGLGTGAVVIFNAGLTFAGSFQGTADPDSATLIGEIDAKSTVTIGGGTQVEVAAGQVQGKMIRNPNIFSSASVRIIGTADVEFSQFANAPFDEVLYDVFGFKQAEAQ